jgi:hypothetical protein
MQRRRFFIVSVFVIILGAFVFEGSVFAQNDITKRKFQGGVLRRLQQRYIRPAVSDYEKINVIGETSKFGMYDPSVEYDENGVGWLAYTASEGDNIQLMGTHLAKSTDHGKTWTFVGKANSDTRKTLVLDGKETEVNYRQETASLLFDPFDPDLNRRWKLFTARGFIKIGGKYSDTDWGAVHIVYRSASSPEQLYSSKEKYLFGSSACQMPVCSAEYDLNNFNPDLRDTIFYEEPGSLARDDVLYLTLSAVTHKGQNTILLSSDDHGETWKYIGTLTSGRDARSLGFNELTSSSLAEEGGKVFLLASPVKTVRFPRHLQYNGVYIFEFDDFSKGRLKRDGSGDLVVQKYIPAIATRSVGGGQSEYHEQNTYGGVIMAQSDARAPFERFQIFNMRERITAK